MNEKRFELFEKTEFQNFLQPWWMNQRRFELFEKWKQKWAEQVGQNQLFCILLKIGSFDFFDILH